MATVRPGEYSNRVYQAQGIVSVQATCTLDDALAKMKSDAAASGQTLEETALDVIEHRIWLG